MTFVWRAVLMFTIHTKLALLQRWSFRRRVDNESPTGAQRCAQSGEALFRPVGNFMRAIEENVARIRVVQRLPTNVHERPSLAQDILNYRTTKTDAIA
jgi:membrane protein implicated in regulation of membrane protease activity